MRILVVARKEELMGAFVSIPFRTGHQTIVVGGVVIIDFDYSLDGKGVITITVGDPWEVQTEKLPPAEFAARNTKVVRSVAEDSYGEIRCIEACTAALVAALKSGEIRAVANEKYINCIRKCVGAPPV
jgi:hypothetical protein